MVIRKQTFGSYEKCASPIPYRRTRVSFFSSIRSEQFLTYYDLGGVYAFENLRVFNQRESMPIWTVTLIWNDLLFENMRDESKFQQIIRDVEAKYQAE